MSKFWALLKFEFMSNSSRFKDEGIFARIRKAIVTILGITLIVALFLYALNIIMEIFVSANIAHEFLTIFITFMMLLHLILGVTEATKILFTKVDLSIIKLPVDGVDVFTCKFIYLYTKQLFFSLVITLPTLILFGIKTGAGALFYIMLLPNILFLPIIPMLLAVLVSVPVMEIINIFKTKFVVLLIFYTITIVIAFTLYIYGLKFILTVLESGDFANVFDSSTIYAIKQFAACLYLPLLYRNIMLGYNFTKSVTIILAILVVLVACVYLFAKKAYFNLLISSKNQRAFYKKTNVVSDRQAISLTKKEFKTIFRSPNYAFQYMTIVFTTPLMVYFSSKIVSFVSADALGANALPGIVVLVLIMFLSMGTSFSATTITREGGNFFLTKIMPVKYTKQITVKFLIYLAISIPAIFVSCIVLAIAKFISFYSAIMIAFALSFVITGNICNSIYMDMRRPQFQYIENGEISSNTKNISASIGIGFTISFIMGIGGIILSIFVSVPSMYLAMYGFGVPFALIEMFRLFYKLDKRYDGIEA